MTSSLLLSHEGLFGRHEAHEDDFFVAFVRVA
jgi:hypothetical protein